MDDQTYVYLTAAVISGLFVFQVIFKKFDPFEPVWMFLAGYLQVYVVQAISYREYALRARGLEIVNTANSRALWAICWFLLVYFFGPGRLLARRLPRAPERWSHGLVLGTSPILIGWGLLSAWFVFRLMSSQDMLDVSQEQVLLLQFPVLALIAGVLFIVTGRDPAKPTPWMVVVGTLIGVGYVLLWMFNTKRSHSLFGVLATLAAFYISKYKRPRLMTLLIAGVIGILALSISLGWRNNRQKYSMDATGFIEYLGDFEINSIFRNLNIEVKDENSPELEGMISRETEEYGGYLLMLYAVPNLSSYDYGSCYLRIVSTYVPRILWPDKPLYGREEWISAWIAGSEFPRESTFTGPAIGILGAMQLNGGATATFLVMAALATILRTAYEYFRRFEHTPWAQLWWSMTYFNAWLMTVNDDPFVWFYYVYGHTTFPPILFFWVANRLGGSRKRARNPGPMMVQVTLSQPTA